MTDVEDMLRASLRQHADDAPQPAADLPESIRAKHRRRARWQAVGATVSVLALVGACVGIGFYLHDSHGSYVGPASMPSPLGHTRTVAFHGIEINVPASWGTNATRCGTPTRNTVIADEGAVNSCATPRPAGVQSLELQPLAGNHLTDELNAAKRRAQVDGVPIRQGSYKGRTVVVVPDPGVVLVVQARPVVAAQIIHSIRRATLSPLGCRMHQRQMYPPHVRGFAVGGPLIPRHPSRISICHYAQGWLMSEAAIRGGAAQRVISLLDGLRPGYSTVPRRQLRYTDCSSAPDEAGNLYLLRVTDMTTDSLVPLRVFVHVQFCGKLGAFTPTGSGQFSFGLVDAVTRPLHTGAGFPDPRTLVVHQSRR